MHSITVIVFLFFFSAENKMLIKSTIQKKKNSDLYKFLKCHGFGRYFSQF